MLTVLIGHRGVGKSGLLKRIQAYNEKRNVLTIDLDAEIEKKSGKTISEIFKTSGEDHFRSLEKETFEELLVKHPPDEGLVFLAVGAGFDVNQIPDGVRTLWVRRKTDPVGRVFLDRPSLEKDLSPLEEYRKRYEARNPRFEEAMTEEVTLLEGLTEPKDFERDLFTGSVHDVSAILTLLPEHLKTHEDWRDFITPRLGWGLSYFEVRDDLLSPEQVDMVFTEIPPEKLIYSFRKKAALLPDPDKLSKVALWDWALELGSCPFGSPSIVSLHDRNTNESIEDAIVRLESAAPRGAYLKLACYAHSFQELEAGYRWLVSRAPQASFLPRSRTGRWNWFRCLLKNRMPLNFVREGMGSAIDQPHLLEWLATPQNVTGFAAVLGYPVNHSFTPVEHYDFFKEMKRPVFAIALGEPEWDEAMPLIDELGLTHAAVTSPLKLKAFEWVQSKTDLATQYQAVNTLLKDPTSGEWVGHSTDALGLNALLTEAETAGEVVIWGGGGVLSQIKEVLPQAQLYSARSGSPREGSEGAKSPELVVWAAPRAKEYQWPPESWKPKQVIDLNYREDSVAREYALKTGAQYISGLAMFKAQAEAQRDFWKKK